jgi:hypothetical protein
VASHLERMGVLGAEAASALPGRTSGREAERAVQARPSGRARVRARKRRSPRSSRESERRRGHARRRDAALQIAQGVGFPAPFCAAWAHTCRNSPGRVQDGDGSVSSQRVLGRSPGAPPRRWSQVLRPEQRAVHVNRRAFPRARIGSRVVRPVTGNDVEQKRLEPELREPRLARARPRATRTSTSAEAWSSPSGKSRRRNSGP